MQMGLISSNSHIWFYTHFLLNHAVFTLLKVILVKTGGEILKKIKPQRINCHVQGLIFSHSHAQLVHCFYSESSSNCAWDRQYWFYKNNQHTQYASFRIQNFQQRTHFYGGKRSVNTWEELGKSIWLHYTKKLPIHAFLRSAFGGRALAKHARGTGIDTPCLQTN